METLNTLDLIIFILYFVILIFIGFWAGRKKSTDATDFFISNKSLPWYAIGFAIIAAGISSEQFLGTVGFAYSHGLPVANWEWLNGPSIIILVFIFVPFYIRKKVITMPQFLEMRFDGKVRSLFAVITILTYIFINLAGVIFSGGYALNKIFGLNLYIGIWGLTIMAGMFTIYGGMASVAWTNVFQSVLLIGSGLLVFVIGLFSVDGGWSSIIADGTRSHLILPASDPDLPGTGLLVLAFSTNVWFFCTNQTINQAALGAKDEWHARLGILLAGFLGILIAFADVFPGMIAFALDPNLSAADEAYPFVVHSLIPLGLKGIVFAGLTGAIISTIEALLNATSTIFTYDIYARISKKEIPDRQLIVIGRTAGAIVLIIGALWAPVVLRFGHIFSYFQECWAFISIPIAIVFVGGVLWNRAGNKAALYTLYLAFPMLALPYILRLMHVEMNVFNVAGFVLIFTIIYFLLAGYMTPAPGADKKLNYIWKPQMIFLKPEDDEKHKKWYQNLFFWAIMMATFYAVIYIIFW